MRRRYAGATRGQFGPHPPFREQHIDWKIWQLASPVVEQGDVGIVPIVRVKACPDHGVASAVVLTVRCIRIGSTGDPAQCLPLAV